MSETIAALLGGDPGKQLGEGKWLHEIVVAPGLETFDAVVDAIDCRQEDNRRG